MSDAPRGPDRRQQGRREVDIATHLLEQGVLSAAVMFIELEGGAPADERIAAHRTLRDRVQDYLKHTGQEGQADLADLGLMALVALAVIIPGSLIGPGWGRYFLALGGLLACAALLWRGERGRR